MIGVDITSINRFKDKKISFVKKVLTDEEFSDWEKAENKELFLAQRWSIKEALFKADNSLYEYNKINIKRNKIGFFEYKNFKISTSKENEYVIAFVMRLKND